jgi:hypothetical protein
MTSHLLRKNILQQLHDQYIHLVNERCYPLIIEIFNEYRKWIKQQAIINQELQRIRFSFEDQCKNATPVNDLRQIITNELQKMGIIHSSLLSDHSSMIPSENNNQIYPDQQLINVNVNPNFSQLNNRVVNEISSTMQKTIEQAENNMNMLNNMIKQLQQQIRN